MDQIESGRVTTSASEVTVTAESVAETSSISTSTVSPVGCTLSRVRPLQADMESKRATVATEVAAIALILSFFILFTNCSLKIRSVGVDA